VNHDLADRKQFQQTVNRSLLTTSRANLLVATSMICLTYVLCRESAPDSAATWLVISLLVTVVRFHIHQRLLKWLKTVPAVPLRALLYASMVAGGLVWGAGSVLFFSTTSVLTTSVIVLIVLGMCSAGAFSYALDSRLVVAYVLPAVVPLAGLFAWHLPQYALLFLIMLVLYLLGLVNAARSNQRLFAESYALSQESERLWRSALEASRRLQAYVDNTPLGFVEWSSDHRVIDWNPAATRILGFTREQALQLSAEDFNVTHKTDEEFRQFVPRWLNSGATDTVVRMARADGTFIYCKWSNSPLLDQDGEIRSMASFVEDITAQVRNRQTIQRQLLTDALTGLPNRTSFTDSLAGVLGDMQLQPMYAAVILLDIDNFKDINDTRGHHYGDQILVEFGRRLRQLVPQEYQVARFGGDEFVLVLPGLSDTEEDAQLAAIRVAESILGLCEKSHQVLGEEFYVNASMGIALFTDSTLSENEILLRADLALYEAKKSGRYDYRFHSPDMSQRAQAVMTLAQELRDAVREGALVPWFHPIFATADDRLCGVEVLLRWLRADGSITTASEFIHVLENSPVYLDVATRTLDTVCRHLRRWQDSGAWREGMRLYFNLSPEDLRHHSFTPMFTETCRRHGVEPSLFEFELTERSLFQQTERVTQEIQALSDLGARIVIDDFGTGFSSLPYIKHLPIDGIKIDRTFIQDFLHNENDFQLIRAILSMSNALNLDCLAEGVESQAQLRQLRSMGCRYYQGFLVAQPMTLKSFERFLDRGPAAITA